MIDAAKRRLGETWRVLTLLTVKALTVLEGGEEALREQSPRGRGIRIEISGARIPLCIRKDGVRVRGLAPDVNPFGSVKWLLVDLRLCITRL